MPPDPSKAPKPNQWEIISDLSLLHHRQRGTVSQAIGLLGQLDAEGKLTPEQQEAYLKLLDGVSSEIGDFQGILEKIDPKPPEPPPLSMTS